jgi:hypothetical protein
MKALELAGYQKGSWRKIPFTLTTGVLSEIAWLRQLSRLDAPGDAKEKPPKHRAADLVAGWVILFQVF